MKNILARRDLPFRRGHGELPALTHDDLAVNFSHVLHEHPDSPAVLAAVSAASRKLRVPRDPAIVADLEMTGSPDIWLVPSVGVPDLLEPVLIEHLPDAGAQVVRIDQGELPHTNVVFFGAPARLTIPGGALTVGVAALVRRPGGTSVQLMTRGPFVLPDQTGEALRALETIIQAHADQWRPGACLWEAAFNPSRK